MKAYYYEYVNTSHYTADTLMNVLNDYGRDGFQVVGTFEDKLGNYLILARAYERKG